MMQGLEKRPYNGMPKEYHLFSLLKGGLRETVIMVYAVSRQIEIQRLKVEVGRVQTENEVRIFNPLEQLPEGRSGSSITRSL